MPLSAWIFIAIIGAVVVVLGVLDGIRRARIRDAETRMSPEEREIRQRERAAFQQVFRRKR